MKNSKTTDVTSGVPRGGPILFIFYIIDLPDCVLSVYKTFADEMKKMKMRDF